MHQKFVAAFILVLFLPQDVYAENSSRWDLCATSDQPLICKQALLREADVFVETEEIKLWLNSMLQTQTAILPFQPEIIKKTILTLALYTEGIIERKLFSKEGLAYIN